MIRINLAGNNKSRSGFLASLKNLFTSKKESAGPSAEAVVSESDPSSDSKLSLNQPAVNAVLASGLCYFAMLQLEQKQQEELAVVDAEIKVVEQNKSEVEQKLAKTKGYEAIKKQLEDDEKALQTKIDVLNQLSKDRNMPSKLLLQIAQTIPESVWLNELRLDEKAIQLVGSTPAYTDVSDFMKTLNSTSYFSDISLNGIQENQNQLTSKGERYQNFELRALRREAANAGS